MILRYYWLFFPPPLLYLHNSFAYLRSWGELWNRVLIARNFWRYFSEQCRTSGTVPNVSRFHWARSCLPLHEANYFILRSYATVFAHCMPHSRHLPLKLAQKMSYGLGEPFTKAFINCDLKILILAPSTWRSLLFYACWATARVRSLHAILKIFAFGIGPENVISIKRNVHKVIH